MKSGLNESMKLLHQNTESKKITSEISLNIPEKKQKVQAAFTVDSEIYDKIDKLAKINKTTKTVIVKSIFDAVYEDGNFNIDIDRKEDENKNLLNVKIDKDLNRSLKKLSKDKNKSFGEILEDIFNNIKQN
ncbi:MAG: hypothetical protein ACRCWG_03185 [Sarcina sp.]